MKIIRIIGVFSGIILIVGSIGGFASMIFNPEFVGHTFWKKAFLFSPYLIYGVFLCVPFRTLKSKNYFSFFFIIFTLLSIIALVLGLIYLCSAFNIGSMIALLILGSFSTFVPVTNWYILFKHLRNN